VVEGVGYNVEGHQKTTYARVEKILHYIYFSN
jgi:hypothetical protein